MSSSKQSTLQSFFSKPSKAADGTSAPVEFKSIPSDLKSKNGVKSANGARRSATNVPGSAQDADLSPPTTKRRKVAEPSVEKEKYVLDFGQKDLQKRCAECGMIYCPGLEYDEKIHKIYHKQKLSPVNITWAPWKTQCIVKEFPDSGDFIVQVNRDDSDFDRKKIVEIREFINSQFVFGTVNMTDRVLRNEKLFVYVHQKKVIGCVFVERIERAFRLEGPVDEPTISKESEPATIGISRIWVHDSFRQKHIATKLLDAVRVNYSYGTLFPKQVVAMSKPTPEGKLFAAKYFGSAQFLVYE